MTNLLENILKLYRLNVLKEIASGFKHGLQTTLKFPTGISVGLLL